MCGIVYFIPFQMSTNSSFNNHLLLHLSLSSSNSNIPSVANCSMSMEHVIVFVSVLFTQCVLLMPVSVVVFSLGLKRWFEQWFESRPSTVSHSDAVMYHMAAIQIMGVLGVMMMLHGPLQTQPSQLLNGYNIYLFRWYGQTFFYLLTCTKHYLAAVHPIFLSEPAKRAWNQN